MSRRRIALVTGASGGIGEEVARLCAADGCDLVLVARRRDKLAELAGQLKAAHGTTSTVLPDDLSDPAAPRRIVDELGRLGLPVDLLVNNAGFGTYGSFAGADLEEQLQMIAINVTALTALTRLILPQMLARRSGRILNVASTASFQPGPLMAVYYATKAYVLFLSEALTNELAGTGVTSTALCPGPTRTGFQSRAGMGELRLLGLGVMDAASVARAGYAGMQRGRAVVIPGAMNRLLALTVRITPRRLVRAVVRRLQERRGPHAAH